MRLLLRAAAPAAMLLLCAPAQAEGLHYPDGSCFLFCNSTPTPAPTPAPSATPAAQPATETAAHEVEPVRRHFRHHRYVAGAATARAPATPEAPAYRHPYRWRYARPAVAVAAHAPETPPPGATDRTARVAPPPTPAPTVEPAPAPSAQMVANVAPEAPAVAPTPAPQEPASPDALRRLADAFAQRPQPAPVAAPSPQATLEAAAPAPTPEAAAPQPQPVPPEPAVRRPVFAEMTADGLVFPWWPASLPGRAAVWLATLFMVAAAALSLLRIRGRGPARARA